MLTDLQKTGESNIKAKVCTTCKVEKPVGLFEADKRYKSGYRSQCIQCRYSNQIVSKTSYHLKRTYGISESEYQGMLSEQNYVCAICKLPETRIVKSTVRKYTNPAAPRLAVDHDHITGKNRGLLCAKCNIGLGHFQDNIDNLESAIAYLKKWNA